MAAPFVQGRLRSEHLSATIDTECAHCGRRLRMDVDSEFGWRVVQQGAKPLVFSPHVDWTTFDEPNILHAF